MPRKFEHWHAVPYFDWVTAFSRLPVGSTVKLVGYALALNATSKTGKDAHPGMDLLMIQTGLRSEKTVGTALAELRRLGLVSRVFEGSKAGRRGLADDYWLALHNEARVAAGKKPCECKNP